MDFAFTPEQEDLRSAAREWLADRWPIARVVAEIDREDRGFDAAAWRELGQLGWLDRDLTLLDQAVLAEESGAALLPLPWWSSVALAGPFLDDELRAAVAAGDRAVAVAWAELPDEGVDADPAGRLSGRRSLVPDLAVVTDVVTHASDGQVYVVDLVEHPESVQRRSTIDRSRPLGELRLDGTPARAMPGVTLAEAIHDAQRRSVALLCCEAVGVAQQALDLTAAYTKERQQFGRVIGTYQGVSHKVADIYVATQLGRSMAYWAAWAAERALADADGTDKQPTAEMALAGAKSDAGEAAVFACEQAIQAHGGIGFTWEHPLHRYYKRAEWIDAFDGSGREQREQIAVALLDEADVPLSLEPV